MTENTSGSKLYYNTPAENFNEALPIGAGRFGGCVYGKPNCEEISLNEDSVWSGGFRERDNPSALLKLNELRYLLMNKEFSKAEDLIKTAFIGLPCNNRHYMPVGKLSIVHKDIDNAQNYKRCLDLKTAVAYTSFDCNDTHYEREYFASHADNCIIIRLKSDKVKKLNTATFIDGRDDYYDLNRPYDENILIYTGSCGGKDGISFMCAIGIKADGDISFSGNNLLAENSCDIVIAISIRTSFYSDNYKDLAINDVKNALNTDYEVLKQRHIEDYCSLFEKCSLDLNDNSNVKNLEALTTDERINRINANFTGASYSEKSLADALDFQDNVNHDNKLIELYFNYGRYLMISASRKGSLPMNLQGIWNEDMWPAWGSRYTININTQMNYWPSEICNLSQCHEPLFDHISRMVENGKNTARTMYGCRGFCCHHNTDIWGDTAPQDIWIPGTLWPLGAAWLCLHITERYKFTKDKEFLREKMPILREACLFFKDFLFEGKEGYLVSCPSVSPENTFLADNGQKGSNYHSCAMDMQIIGALLKNTIYAADELSENDEFIDELKEMLKKLLPTRIGKHGQIMEWAEDFEETEVGHRHISQLFALYPDDAISLDKTPEFALAAKKTIERRLESGGGHTGWSRAWLINMWARLRERDRVYSNLLMLIGISTYKNMFDMHPPFQIDGNFGGCAGIAEALLQSHNDCILLLPALPLQFESGRVTGLCARGGFEISIVWEKSKLKSAEIISKCGSKLNITTNIEASIYNSSNKLLSSGTNFIVDTKIGDIFHIKVNE